MRKKIFTLAKVNFNSDYKYDDKSCSRVDCSEYRECFENFQTLSVSIQHIFAKLIRKELEDSS